MRKASALSFLPLMRRHISGPLESMMVDAIKEAAITFCRKSELITLVRVVASAAAGSLLDVCDQDGLKASNIVRVINSDGDDLVPGVDYMAMSANEISIPAPLANFTVWYSAEPLPDAADLPSVLLDDYGESVAFGALAILFGQPGMPWTDGKRSAYYQAEFTEGFRRATRFRLDHSTPKQTKFDNPVRKHTFF